jgi:hypothetical protein
MTADQPPARSGSHNRGIAWLPIVLLCLYGIFALPLVIHFAGNHHFRHVFYNLVAHCRVKLIPPRTVHVGDSITSAGGHWSFLLGTTPFDSINLAGDGYMVSQVRSQVRKALGYRPAVILVKAGVNDVMSLVYDEKAVLSDFLAITKEIAASSSQCLVTLPTKLRDPDKSQSIAALNARLMAVLPAAGCQVVDLNPDLAPDGELLERFTSDGVHLSPKAYRLWADRLKPLLP